MSFFVMMKKAYRDMPSSSLNMTFRSYFWIIMMVSLLSIAFLLTINLLFPEFYQDWLLSAILIITPLYIIIVLLLYPVVLYQRRGIEIDNDMHLFITRIGVLALADAPAKTVFNLLEKMKEYRQLAGEVKKIYILTDKWHIPLERACRTVARLTPSEVFANFLLRLAHATEVGESVEDFFIKEQSIILNEYSARYENSLMGLKYIEEIFTATMTSMAFGVVLVELLLMLTGQSSSSLIAFMFILFVLVEVFIAYVVKSMIPGEVIWHTMEQKTEVKKKLNRLLVLTVTGSILLFIIASGRPFFQTIGEFLNWKGMISFSKIFVEIPPALAVAIGSTPLLYVGIYTTIEEGKILNRDLHFPSFLRSLGISSEAKGREALSALDRLRRHDFGELSENIDSLYKRLKIRINKVRAWILFGADTGSELISKFAEMYIEGTRLGGSSKKIGVMVSDNFTRITDLRVKKFESASTFTVVLYGLLISITIVLYLTLAVVNSFYTLYQGIEIPPGYEFISLFSPSSLDVGFIEIFVLGICIFHAFLSSLLIKIITGGHKAGALLHFSIMCWIIAGLSAGVMKLVSGILD
ncbi:MAG: type II secretion system F family protein [Thermoplasmata archaeon]